MPAAPTVPRKPGAEVVIEGVPYRYVKTFKDDFFAENHLMEAGDRQYVLKISRVKLFGGLGTGVFSRYMARREYNLYARVDGVPGVPRLTGRAGNNGFLHEFVPGETLYDRRDVDVAFFDRLRACVEAIHDRGVAYVDLAKRENIIVGDDRRPYLIDFQIGLARAACRWCPLTWLYNRVVARMMREDLAHVLKHKRKVIWDLCTEEERQVSYRRSFWRKLHMSLFRKPWLLFKRTFISPKGGSV
jgi:hypothetical protein